MTTSDDLAARLVRLGDALAEQVETIGRMRNPYADAAVHTRRLQSLEASTSALEAFRAACQLFTATAEFDAMLDAVGLAVEPDGRCTSTTESEAGFVRCAYVSGEPHVYHRGWPVGVVDHDPLMEVTWATGAPPGRGLR